MTAFDPTTAYANRYGYLRNVESTIWEYGTGPTQVTGFKARWGDIDSPDLVSVAAGLGLSMNAAAVVVWQATAVLLTGAFTPKEGHVLRGATSGAWLIKSTHASMFSYWVCLCEKVIANG